MPCAVSDEALDGLLREDAPFGDLTTRALGLGSGAAQICFYARQAMRLCGSEEAGRLMELAGGRVEHRLPSGIDLAPGTLFLSAHGTVEALHWAWKTAQTLVEALSGMASATAEIKQALMAEGLDVPLACTRKNFPGTRALAAKAVVAGGGVAHRLGLSETLLVFPDHRVFVDNVTLPELFARIRRTYPEKKLVAEARDEAEALWLAQCGADVLQLERFSPAALKACRTALHARGVYPLLVPAGGVTLANAVAYAQAGADFLVSSAPYFAPPRDVQVTFLRP